MKKLCILILLIVSLFASGCGVNDNPPQYIKDVVAYEEGDGVIVYFILADEDGMMTTSDGKVVLSIFEVPLESQISKALGGPEIEGRELYAAAAEVEKSGFYKAKIREGSHKYDALIYLFKWIPYSAFHTPPATSNGKVKLLFGTPDGRVLEGEGVAYFNR